VLVEFEHNLSYGSCFAFALELDCPSFSISGDFNGDFNACYLPLWSQLCFESFSLTIRRTSVVCFQVTVWRTFVFYVTFDVLMLHAFVISALLWIFSLTIRRTSVMCFVDAFFVTYTCFLCYAWCYNSCLDVTYDVIVNIKNKWSSKKKVSFFECIVIAMVLKFYGTCIGKQSLYLDILESPVESYWHILMRPLNDVFYAIFSSFHICLQNRKITFLSKDF